MDEPTRQELLDGLLELVLDMQEMGHMAHNIPGRDDVDWRAEWKADNASWYGMYDRNRKLLERAGVQVPEVKIPRRRRPEKACPECGYKRKHLPGCSRAVKVPE